MVLIIGVQGSCLNDASAMENPRKLPELQTGDNEDARVYLLDYEHFDPLAITFLLKTVDRE